MKYIGKYNGDYIIDKKVRRDKTNDKVLKVKIIPSAGMKRGAAIEFLEDEKEWLDKNNRNIVWEVIYD